MKMDDIRAEGADLLPHLSSQRTGVHHPMPSIHTGSERFVPAGEQVDVMAVGQQSRLLTYISVLPSRDTIEAVSYEDAQCGPLM
jgi:hypothetical protein